MATEQRFLGELLSRRGVVPADKLDGLFAVQRERGTELLDLVINDLHTMIPRRATPRWSRHWC